MWILRKTKTQISYNAVIENWQLLYKLYGHLNLCWPKWMSFVYYFAALTMKSYKRNAIYVGGAHITGLNTPQIRLLVKRQRIYELIISPSNSSWKLSRRRSSSKSVFEMHLKSESFNRCPTPTQQLHDINYNPKK